jgi:hypothetical protein
MPKQTPEEEKRQRAIAVRIAELLERKKAAHLAT